MKRLLLASLFTFFIALCDAYADPVVKFTKTSTTITRKPATSYYPISLSATGITVDQTVQITKLFGNNHVTLNNDPTIHKFLVAQNNNTWPVMIQVDNDTTDKNTEYYGLELTYQYTDPTGKAVVVVERHTIALQKYQEESPDNSLIRNDFLLFAGSNFDPANDKSTITSSSFEAIAKFEFKHSVHMRVGGYTYRNFSTDSGSIRQTAYVNTNPGNPIRTDTTRLAVQQYSLNRQTTVRSYGIYADLYWAVLNERAYRVSPFVRYEYAFRDIRPVISDVESRIVDTITYNQSLRNQNIVIRNTLVSTNSVNAISQSLKQHYLVFGVAVEYSSKAFDLFFQPTVGAVITYQELVQRRTILISKMATVGIKAQVLVKVVDATLAVDLKDINTIRPFTNISIGIPVSYSKLKEKLK